MTDMNPYQSPTQPLVADGVEEYGDIRIFSASGRLGRLRYIAYSIGITMLIYLVAGLGMALSSALPATASPILMSASIGIAAIVTIIITVMLMAQRLHDTNNTGWWMLLIFIPVVSLLFTLYLWFMPGTKGMNNYGNPPPPNKNGIVLVVVIVGAIFILGIMAAIAIPAYQDYMMRAQQATLGQP